jgi:hypothetical protein
MRVGELVEQAGLAHPRLADGRHQLAVSGAGEVERFMELLGLAASANEPRRTALGSRL